MKNKTILVTGASGFIGHNFCISAKNKGYEVIALSRNKIYAEARLKEIKVVTSLEEIPSTKEINFVLNLAGESLASGRWNKKLKQKFINSRLDMTNKLYDYFTNTKSYPEVIISGSAVGYYGPQGDNFIDEDSSYNNSYTNHLCALWENNASRFVHLGSRVCFLRIGIVLGEGEGALKRMIPPFNFGLGGKLGTGKQWFPWIHIKDQINLIFHCLEHQKLSGAINSCSPNPVTNQEFTRELGSVLSRPVFLSMPSFIAKVIFGEMANELLLKGQRVVPKKALNSGFIFTYSHIDQALKNILVSN